MNCSTMSVRRAPLVGGRNRSGFPGNSFCPAKGKEPHLAKPGPRIAVVDDDEHFHLLIKELGALGKFKLAGSFYDAAQALDGLAKARPDAVIMDIVLPDMSGIDCTSKLKTILPKLPILILTGYPDGRNFFRSLMAGANGFLVKPVMAREITSAIEDLLKGELVRAKQVVPFLVQLIQQIRQLAQDNQSLTKREEEILACLFEELQDKEIASALGIGTATVHTHMHRLFEKLGVHSRKETIAKYLTLAEAKPLASVGSSCP